MKLHHLALGARDLEGLAIFYRDLELSCFPVLILRGGHLAECVVAYWPPGAAAKAPASGGADSLGNPGTGSRVRP